MQSFGRAWTCKFEYVRIRPIDDKECRSLVSYVVHTGSKKRNNTWSATSFFTRSQFICPDRWITFQKLKSRLKTIGVIASIGTHSVKGNMQRSHSKITIWILCFAASDSINMLPLPTYRYGLRQFEGESISSLDQNFFPVYFVQ